MSRCEDWPCCGHEAGCCPDYDESGQQLNMKCVCGAAVPLGSRFSICESCLNTPDPQDIPEYPDHYYEDREYIFEDYQGPDNPDYGGPNGE